MRKISNIIKIGFLQMPPFSINLKGNKTVGTNLRKVLKIIVIKYLQTQSKPFFR